MPTLATFNANNFFLRYRFANTFPGDTSKKSAIEAADVGTLGYVPEKKFGNALSKDFVIWDPVRRDLAAQALKEPDGKLPDILCLQEVENMDAIRKFNENHLAKHYEYALLIDGWDPRNIDVAILSRFPITEIRSHLDDTDSSGSRILSRDCLEVTFALKAGERLTVFVNHLKSKFINERGKTAAKIRAERLASHQRREAQAKYVLQLVKDRFKGQHDSALYAVVGDFNDTDESPWIRALLRSNLLTDVLTANRAAQDRWTYYWRAKGRVQQIDYILASKRLASRVAGSQRKTHIERRGLAYRTLNAQDQILPAQVTLTHFEDDGVTPTPSSATPDTKLDFRFPRYDRILDDASNNISDHCPVKVWF